MHSYILLSVLLNSSILLQEQIEGAPERKTVDQAESSKSPEISETRIQINDEIQEVREEGHKKIETDMQRAISETPSFKRQTSHKFTQKELEDLKIAFEIYDINKNGEICAEELKITMRKLGMPVPKDEELQKMINAVDRNDNGTVDFSEFLVLMSQGSIDDIAETRKIFDNYDKNKDGYISAEELKVVQMFADINLEDAMKAVDKNGDGLIDFTEFQALLTYAEAIDESHETQDDKKEQ